jgi:hypothetical protein
VHKKSACETGCFLAMSSSKNDLSHRMAVKIKEIEFVAYVRVHSFHDLQRHYNRVKKYVKRNLSWTAGTRIFSVK